MIPLQYALRGQLECGQYDLGDCEVLVHGASEGSRLITSVSQGHGPPQIKLQQWSSSSSLVFSIRLV